MSEEWSDRYSGIEPEEYRQVEMHPPAKTGVRDRRAIVETLLVSIVVVAGALVIYDRYFAQKIVALDVKGYIAEQRDLYLAGKINDVQLKESIDRLEKAKERVPANRIIILGDVLVRKNVEEIKP